LLDKEEKQKAKEKREKQETKRSQREEKKGKRKGNLLWLQLSDRVCTHRVGPMVRPLRFSDLGLACCTIIAFGLINSDAYR